MSSKSRTLEPFLRVNHATGDWSTGSASSARAMLCGTNVVCSIVKPFFRPRWARRQPEVGEGLDVQVRTCGGDRRTGLPHSTSLGSADTPRQDLARSTSAVALVNNASPQLARKVCTLVA